MLRNSLLHTQVSPTPLGKIAPRNVLNYAGFTSDPVQERCWSSVVMVGSSGECLHSWTVVHLLCVSKVGADKKFRLIEQSPKQLAKWYKLAISHSCKIKLLTVRLKNFLLRLIWYLPLQGMPAIMLKNNNNKYICIYQTLSKTSKIDTF